mgnify:FL=1
MYIRNLETIFGFFNNLKLEHYEIGQVVNYDGQATYIDDYHYFMKLKIYNVIKKAKHYISSLFFTEKEKRNIERMAEQNNQDYLCQQHFITHSPWSSKDVMMLVAKKVNKSLGDVKLQCLLIDESSDKKAGKHSLGVSRQHNGNLGKI